MKTDKHKAETLKNEGNAFAKQKKHSQAISKYLETLALDPALASAHFNIGIMYKQIKRYSEAEQAFKQALCIQPSYAKAKLNLFTVFVLLNQVEEAFALYSELPPKDCENEEIILAKYRLDKKIQAHVGYFTLDLKLTNQGVKILQIRDGMCSKSQGLDSSTIQNKAKRLKHELYELAGRPVFLAAQPGVHTIKKTAIVESIQNEFTAAPKGFLPSDLSSFRGIVAGEFYGTERPETVLHLNRFLGFMLDHKILMHRIFEQSHSAELRPLSKVYERSYSPNLVKQILDDFPATQWVVLKSVDPNHADVALFINKAELNQYLSVLFNRKKQVRDDLFMEKLQALISSKVNIHDMSANNVLKIKKIIRQLTRWSFSDETHFLVEEFVANKPYEGQDNNIYNPTMRVTCLAKRSAGKISIKPLECYWRIPKQPINARCDIADKSISDDNISEQNIVNDDISIDQNAVAEVSKADQRLVFDQLQRKLPRLYSAMLLFDITEWVMELPELTQKDIKNKSLNILRFANSCTHEHDFLLARYLHERAKSYPHDKTRLYHEIGLRCQVQGNHFKAINNFKKAIQSDQTFAPAYYRLAHTQFEVNKRQEALHNCDICLKLDPYYKVKINNLKINYDNRKPHNAARFFEQHDITHSELKPEPLKGLENFSTMARVLSEQICMVDLHGDSVETAEKRVRNTILFAKFYRQKMVRFVTGRGNHMNAQGKRGTLYQIFPRWIESIKKIIGDEIDSMRTYEGYYEILFKDTQQSMMEKNRVESLHLLLSNCYEYLLVEAKNDQVEAQLLLALIYKEGIKVKQSYKKSFYWNKRAADQGSGLAQYELAICYFHGRGVKQNDNTAFDYFQKSAVAPMHPCSLAAINQLGDMYAHGLGVEPNPSKANQYFKKVADSGSDEQIVTEASRKVGYNYRIGFGVDVDHELMMKYYHQAADAEPGDPTAQFNLGMLYLEGKLTEKNESKALDYFSLSASQGDGDAHMCISFFYRNGLIYEKDLNEALRHLEKGAQLNSSKAAFELFMAQDLPLREEKKVEYLKQAARLNHPEAMIIAIEMSKTKRHPYFPDDELAYYVQKLKAVADHEIKDIDNPHTQNLILQLLLSSTNSKNELKRAKKLSKELIQTHKENVYKEVNEVAKPQEPKIKPEVHVVSSEIAQTQYAAVPTTSVAYTDPPPSQPISAATSFSRSLTKLGIFAVGGVVTAAAAYHYAFKL